MCCKIIVDPLALILNVMYKYVSMIACEVENYEYIAYHYYETYQIC